MVWQPTFERLQRAIMAENTFPLAYVEAWAWRGACPPPLHGDPGSPISAFISMGLRDRWARDDAPLRVSDEEGVQRQRAVAESEIRRQLDQTVRWPGTDNLLFPEAQAAIKRLGCWVDPPDDHRGSHWSATRPQSWIWGASPHADTCRLLGFAQPRSPSRPSRSARLRSEIRLRQEADRFDRWLLLGVQRNDGD